MKRIEHRAVLPATLAGLIAIAPAIRAASLATPHGTVRTATFAHGGMRVFAVATNVETGKPAYFEKGKTDFPFDEAVRASASLPLASVPVVLDGQPYLDGGCSCPIALNWALNEGFEKIVVITTRQKGFRKAMPGQKMVDLYDDYSARSDYEVALEEVLGVSEAEVLELWRSDLAELSGTRG